MRTLFTTTESRSSFVRRLLIVFVALAAISISSFATVTQAEAMPGMPEDAEFIVNITYLGYSYGGNNNWLIEGVVEAEHLSQVTVKLSGPSEQTATPDVGGNFAFIFVASPDQDVYADATDSSGTSHAQVSLNTFGME